MGINSQKPELPAINTREAQESTVAAGYSLPLFGEEVILLRLSATSSIKRSDYEEKSGAISVAGEQKRLPGLETAGLKIENL